jgi:hypothetical protein
LTGSLGLINPAENLGRHNLASDHVDGEEAVAFSKRKPEEEQGEAPATRPENKKKKERKLHSNNLVAAADKRPPKPKPGPPRDHFEKMLEAPCPYHESPVKHAMKDCNHMKRYLSGKNKSQDAPNASAAKNVEHDEFPREDGVAMMIFSGTLARPLRHKHKHILQEIYHTGQSCPHTSGGPRAITYDRADHILQPGPLVVALLFSTKWVHKVLMDGGSNLNIVYMSTVDSMGI